MKVCEKDLPLLIDNLLFSLLLILSIRFFNCGEITLKSVLVGLEMTRCWIRRINHGVVDIFVEVTDSVTDARLILQAQVL